LTLTFEYFTSDFSMAILQECTGSWYFLIGSCYWLDAHSFPISFYLVSVYVLVCSCLYIFATFSLLVLCDARENSFDSLLPPSVLILCFHLLYWMHVICLTGSAVTLLPMICFFFSYCHVALIPDVDQPKAGNIKYEEGRCCFPAQRFYSCHWTLFPG
jgi:hypothetical protein